MITIYMDIIMSMNVLAVLINDHCQNSVAFLPDWPSPLPLPLPLPVPLPVLVLVKLYNLACPEIKQNKDSFPSASDWGLKPLPLT